MVPPDIVRKVSFLPPDEISKEIKELVRFYYHRHQGIDGSLCIVETDDLHNDSPELISVRAVIGRTRDWLIGTETGVFPADSREVELYHHFPNRCTDIVFFLPDEFYNFPRWVAGKFYFCKMEGLMASNKNYFGFHIEGRLETGVHLYSSVKREKGFFFDHGMPLNAVDLTARTEKALELLEKKTIIEGWWWYIDQEPKPFATVEMFAEYIDPKQGIELLARELENKLKIGESDIYVGFRFYNRRQELEWQFFNLKKITEEPALLDFSLEDAKERLISRKVEAIRAEQITERYFHLRNSSRADRSILRDKSVTVIGTGALGSSLAENLAKAGVGNIYLIDKGILRAHNVIRHTCGLYFVDWPKCNAVALNSVALHNPFVKVKTKFIDILESPLNDYFEPSSIGISTVADDTIEAYLNEESVRSGRTIYYARGLRGGKAARIFRVKPGTDACKECLVHYKMEGDEMFISIDEDPSLPVLTNECNNPVRPGSGADMEIIAGILARIVIDDLQSPSDSYNHWIWHTEALHKLLLDSNEWGSVHRQFIPPHPKCRLCQRLEPKEVLITEEAIEVMRQEAATSGKVETGGILIGFRNESGNIVVVKATGPGPNAVRTENRFEKDVEYCQQRLVEAAKSLVPRGQYVGEWHYHPHGNNEPSGTDIKSLSEIAEQINYATDEPIMVIVSPELEAAFTLHPAYKGYVRTTYQIIDSERVINMEYQLA